MFNANRLTAAGYILFCYGLLVPGPAAAEERQKLAGLHEPVFRVTKQESATRIAEAAKKQHPLDPALEMAHRSLSHIRQDIDDYTCILVKRERVGNRLGAQEFMLAKVRNGKKEGDQVTVPFGVYLKFLKPDKIKGREVIYVAGKNNGNLIAHEGGWKGKVTPSLPLKPTGPIAMMGQRYPITDIGIENLCVRLIEKGQRDKRLGECVVEMQPAKINKRPCTRIQVKHPERLPHLDFHLARIFVDNEHNVPVRYEAYDWPRRTDAAPTEAELIEEYTYVNLKFNVGLTDRDFDPANPKYKMK